MADNPQFYRARAAEQHEAASEATLDNVRERCSRAAKAWETMADRAERTETMRHEREARTGTAAALDLATT